MGVIQVDSSSVFNNSQNDVLRMGRIHSKEFLELLARTLKLNQDHVFKQVLLDIEILYLLEDFNDSFIGKFENEYYVIHCHKDSGRPSFIMPYLLPVIVDSEDKQLNISSGQHYHLQKFFEDFLHGEQGYSKYFILDEDYSDLFRMVRGAMGSCMCRYFCEDLVKNYLGYSVHYEFNEVRFKEYHKIVNDFNFNTLYAETGLFETDLPKLEDLEFSSYRFSTELGKCFELMKECLIAEVKQEEEEGNNFFKAMREFRSYYNSIDFVSCIGDYADERFEIIEQNELEEIKERIQRTINKSSGPSFICGTETFDADEEFEKFYSEVYLDSLKENFV